MARPLAEWAFTGSPSMSAGLPVDGLILLCAALLVVGILVVALSDRLRFPAALVSLAIGMIAGSDGFGLVDLDDPALVRNLSVVALVIILFEGGLTTKPTTLREAGVPGFVLSSLGVLITSSLSRTGRCQSRLGRLARPDTFNLSRAA